MSLSEAFELAFVPAGSKTTIFYISMAMFYALMARPYLSHKADDTGLTQGDGVI
jgi:hypothetical protein